MSIRTPKRKIGMREHYKQREQFHRDNVADLEEKIAEKEAEIDAKIAEQKKIEDKYNNPHN